MNGFGSAYFLSRFDCMKKILLFLFLYSAIQLSFAQQQSFEAEVRWLSSRLDSVGWNPGGTVVTGSSTIKMWSTLKKIDTNEELINTGFGGSKASDLERYLYPLVLKFVRFSWKCQTRTLHQRPTSFKCRWLYPLEWSF